MTSAVHVESALPLPKASESHSEGLPCAFGDFALFDRIGEGGMARIYLGRSTTGLAGERLLVVKRILPGLSQSGEFARLFVDEAKLSAQLTHGNIVQVLDLGRAEGQLYIAMEYVEGFDLRELLRHCSKQRVALPLEHTLRILVEVLRGLDHAHRKRGEDGRLLHIVHRDVSPSNVLVSLDGEIKLCDFGIARAMGVAGAVPSDVVQGKAGYMSPEAARGEEADARSDVFAAGVMLWELLAGRRLYRNPKGGPPTLEQARLAEIPPLPLLGAPDEAALHAIVARALAREPASRWSSARDFLDALEQYGNTHHLLASQLRLGAWVVEHFGAELLQRRGAHERAAAEWEALAEPAAERSTASAPSASPELAPSEADDTRPSEPSHTAVRRRQRGLRPRVVVAAASALALCVALAVLLALR